MGRSDEKLFATLASGAELRVNKFLPQNVASTAWAFATSGQSDEKLFATLTSTVHQRVSALKPQELGNAEWVLATLDQADGLWAASAKEAERRMQED